MDSLQIHHAITQIEIYASELKEFLLKNNSQDTEALQAGFETLESELSGLEDQVDELRQEIFDLKVNRDRAKTILEDLLSQPSGIDYSEEEIQKAIDLL